ncbi:MAG TPA: hypothetical protein VNI57_05535 [Candidatus Saccharimonadales bacterium]|nr:hypothetical protein [Candidatus Saccharimonadales bacterium]
MIAGLLLALAASVAPVTAPSGTTPPPGAGDWKPAQVYSITVGTSHLADLTHTLGKPRQNTENPNLIMKGRTFYQYDVTWPVKGELWAFVEMPDKVVTELLLKSRGARMSDMVKAFGTDYSIERYRIHECEGGHKGMTLCQESRGPTMVFEYRSKGVVVFPEAKGTAGDVYFVAERLDLLNCDCGEGKLK